MARGARRTVLLGSSVAAVINAGGHAKGTAFLVAERLALTCAHVIAAATGGVEPGATVVLRFTQAPQKPEVLARVVCIAPLEDVALLELFDGLLPIPGAVVAPLSDEAAIDDHAFKTYGYPAGFPQALQSRGAIQGNQDGGQFLLMNVGAAVALQDGYSGGPVWDDHVEAVVGMVAQVLDYAEEKSGLATSVRTMRRACPMIPGTSPPVTLGKRLKDVVQRLREMLPAEVLRLSPPLGYDPGVVDDVEYESEGTNGAAYFTAWSPRHPFNRSHPDDGDLFYAVTVAGRRGDPAGSPVEVGIALELSGRGMAREFRRRPLDMMIQRAAALIRDRGVADVVVDEGDWGGLHMQVTHMAEEPLSQVFTRRLAEDWLRLADLFEAFVRQLR